MCWILQTAVLWDPPWDRASRRGDASSPAPPGNPRLGLRAPQTSCTARPPGIRISAPSILAAGRYRQPTLGTNMMRSGQAFGRPSALCLMHRSYLKSKNPEAGDVPKYVKRKETKHYIP
nr:uncharacterized protein LOC113800743 [Penaeus vannamei]